ncbi:MAG: hypothetical protein ACPIOQ_11250, partial [Promethearchaeia archaeon]
ALNTRVRCQMFETIHHFQQLSSCIGTCGWGDAADKNVSFGAAFMDDKNVEEKWLVDNVPMHVAKKDFSMAGTNQGMFNNYSSIHTSWADTTAMDNIRGAASGVAGTLEDKMGEDRTAGHTVHTPSGDCDPRGSVLCPK